MLATYQLLMDAILNNVLDIKGPDLQRILYDSAGLALHLTLNISETVREAWFQRTTNRKWHMGYRISNGHVTDDVT